MVKAFFVGLFLCLFAVPVFAQEDYPRIEMAMGYANVGFDTTGTGENTRHSGFAMHSGLNFSSMFGIENYSGFYSMGNDITLISNIIGGKAAWRRGGKLVPYGVAGLGISYATSSYASSGTAFSTRVGGGVDVMLNDAFSLKFDVSRMGFHFGEWSSGTNFSTGIVFTL